DRTGPGDDANVAAADFQAQHFNDRRLALDLGARHFVRSEDGHDFLDAVHGFEGLLVAVAFFAQGRHHGALGADNHMAAQAEPLDALDHVVDLPLRGPRFHHDDHGNAPTAV